MSVYANKRTESIHQFKEDWLIFVDMFNVEFMKIGNRKRKFYEDRIYGYIYSISSDMTIIDAMILSRERFKNRDEYIKMLLKVSNNIQSLSKYITAVFALTNSSSNRFDIQLNSVINSFQRMLKYVDRENTKLDKIKIDIYDNSKIKGVMFLEKLKELLDMTLAKCPRISNPYMYSMKIPLITYISDVMTLAYNANSIRNDECVRLSERIDMMIRARCLLRDYERILWLSFSNPYLSTSEKTKFAELYTESCKMLDAVINNDKKILKKLKNKQ